MNKLSRRDFLRGAALLAGAAAAGGIGYEAGRRRGIASVEPEIIEKLVEVTAIPEPTVQPDVARDPIWVSPDLSGQEVLIWGLNYDPHLEAYERLAKRFSEYTNVSYTIEAQDWPLEDKIVTGMAAGLVPDVCCIMGKQIAPLVSQDAVVALDDLVYQATGCDMDSWFGPVGLQAYQYEGKTWGVPAEGNCVSGVTNVRLDFVEDADALHMWPPHEGKEGFYGFNEMFALAKALQVTDENGNVTRWGMSSEGWDNRELFGIMRTLGQDWWDGQNFYLDSPEAEEALYLLAYKPIHELKIETHLGTGAEESMLGGKCAIANGNVTMPPSGAEVGVEVDSCIYPSAVPGKDALFVGEGGWGFVVPSQAKNVDAGVEFMKFLTTYEGNKLYCQIYGGIVSAVLAVNNDDELFPANTLVGAAMRRAGIAQARTVYYGSGFGTPSEMEGITCAAVESVRVGKSSVKEALVEAQRLLEEMRDREA